MEALAEKVFFGQWRSYKIFKRLGNIHLNSETEFQEFHFSPDRNLTISMVEGAKTKKITQTDKWTVTFQKSKHFLNIAAPKMSFEVITVNHTVLVLLDIASGEKTFLAKDHHWQEYLKSNRSIVI